MVVTVVAIYLWTGDTSRGGKARWDTRVQAVFTIRDVLEQIFCFDLKSFYTLP